MNYQLFPVEFSNDESSKSKGNAFMKLPSLDKEIINDSCKFINTVEEINLIHYKNIKSLRNSNLIPIVNGSLHYKMDLSLDLQYALVNILILIHQKSCMNHHATEYNKKSVDFQNTNTRNVEDNSSISRIISTDYKEINKSFFNNTGKKTLFNPLYTKESAPDIPLSIQKYHKSNNKSIMSKDIKSKSDIIYFKSLTLPEILQMIKELYQSKNNYNLRCKHTKLVKETTEKHMYTFLTHKFGLPNLVMQYAKGLVQAIKDYSQLSSDVLLFSKILKNQIDENFGIITLENIRKQIHDKIYEISYSKYKNLKSADFLNIVSNKQSLEKDEWESLIKNFPCLDYPKVLSILWDSLKTKNYNMIGDLLHHTKISASREEYKNKELIYNELSLDMPIDDMVEILCVYFINQKEKYLGRFTEIFRQYDLDLYGVITEGNFIDLCTNFISKFLDINEEWIMEKLQVLDPFNTKEITYSECVDLFIYEQIIEVDSEGNSVMSNLIDKLSN